MDLMICVHNKTNNSVQLARYGSTGKKIKDIAVDGHGQELYKHPIYVTENGMETLWFLIRTRKL